MARAVPRSTDIRPTLDRAMSLNAASARVCADNSASTSSRKASSAPFNKAPSNTTRAPAPELTSSSERLSVGFLGRYRRSLWAGAVLAVVSLGGWFLWKRKTEPVPHYWRRSSLEKLQRQSSRAPRSFLETAHKILERYAEENHLIPGSGDKDSPFDQCWFEVEKFRFSGGEPPAEVRQKILQLLQSVPGKQVGTNETTDGHR